ncbi:hypothetical protein [Streptomyces sp. NPDC001135]
MHGETALILSAVDVIGRTAAGGIYGERLCAAHFQLESGSRSSLMTYGQR